MCFRLGFGQPHPCDFRVGIGNRGNGQRFEERLVSCDVLCRNFTLMHCLVRQHRVADDVADGKDMRHVGALLFIHRNKASLIHDDARSFGVDLASVRAAAYRHQHAVVELRLGRLFALKCHAQAFR